LNLENYNLKTQKDRKYLQTNNWQWEFTEINNDNGVRAVNFATSKNLIVLSTMFPHTIIHKYTPDGNMHNLQSDWCLHR